MRVRRENTKVAREGSKDGRERKGSKVSLICILELGPEHHL